MKILLVEDEPEVAAFLKKGLKARNSSLITPIPLNKACFYRAR